MAHGLVPPFTLLFLREVSERVGIDGHYGCRAGVVDGSSVWSLRSRPAATVWSSAVNGAWPNRTCVYSCVEDIAPSAFLVSDCGQIYFSGWGGDVNLSGQSLSSNTTGLPTTPGTFQASTDGSDFYLMVLEPEATGLNYATFFGGGITAEHVDGGTSRFDKNGNVYQAVCAGCGGQDDFPTTPGAWSNTNNSFNCNLGVFKFALAQTLAIIDINGPTYLCDPGSL